MVPATMIRLTVRPDCAITQCHKELPQLAQHPHPGAHRIADSARLKSAAWNGRLERRWPVPVRLGRGRLHLLSREPGSEIGCLPPACGAPSSEGQLHPVRLTAAATLTSAGLCQMRCSRQPSNRPQGGPIRVCGGIATHRPRPRSVRPPQDHLPLAGGHSAVLARRSRHPCNLRGSRRRLRCGNPRPRAANRDGRSQAAPWRPGLLRALPHRVRLWY